MTERSLSVAITIAMLTVVGCRLTEADGEAGFVPLFNGVDLTGWQGRGHRVKWRNIRIKEL